MFKSKRIKFYITTSNKTNRLEIRTAKLCQIINYQLKTIEILLKFMKCLSRIQNNKLKMHI